MRTLHSQKSNMQVVSSGSPHGMGVAVSLGVPRLSRRSASLALTMLTLAAVWAAPMKNAEACGGCIVQTESTVVTDHRMAFSISRTQTVLWDQIRYQGSPEEFVWVLPVKPGARVELSKDAWIGALDALTQPRVIQPFRPMAGGSSGSGCGCAAADSLALSSSAEGASNPVQVVSEKVVGPYQTVVLRSENPAALEDWLTQNGYKIQDNIKPVVRAYVNEKFDFLALRLRPEASVRQMEPVRIISPGADVGLPLRMVAAGVGASVGLTLFVIGEGRYQTANFPNAKLDVTKLFWDFAQNRSNYQALSSEAMAQDQGRTWLSEASLPNSAQNLKDLYFNALAARIDDLPPLPPPVTVDAGADATTEEDSGTEDGGQLDAMAPPNPPTPMPPSTDGADDFVLATSGMNVAGVWVTRLRANLPAATLSQDLRLEAAPEQVGISTQYLARDPDPAQGQSSVSPVAPRSLGTAMVMLMTMGWLAVRLRRRDERP